jgi:hypothetical protein
MKYIARIVFRINHSRSEKIIFDEQLRLIEAENKPEALQFANTIGRREDDVISAEGNTKIHWEFIGVSELSQVKERENGALLYTFTKSASAEGEYITFVKARAQRIAQVGQNEIPSAALEQFRNNAGQ